MVMMMWEEKGDTNKNYPIDKACEKYQLIFPVVLNAVYAVKFALV